MYKRYRLKYLDLRHFSISNIDNLCCLRGHLFEENSSFSTLPLILCNINLQAISVLILYTSPSLCLVIFIVLQNLMDNCVNIKKNPSKSRLQYRHVVFKGGRSLPGPAETAAVIFRT